MDGWVSLEVSPLLANDTAGTITAARELHVRAGRPNLFIKIPGAKQGLPAIEESHGNDCEEALAKFAKAGVDIDALAAQLQDAGAQSFVKSWNELMECITSKSEALKQAG